VLTPGFKEKFNSTEISVLEFLYFIDLLGWNEDVKYLGKKGTTDKGNLYFDNFSHSNNGRTNTIKSVITAPILIGEFIDEVVNKTKINGIIDVKMITKVVQQFSKQGVMTLKKNDMLKHLSPYLVENAN
jgi:hypothetical protein